MSPDGQPVPWTGTLTTTKVGGQLYLFSHEELAPLPNGGGAPVGNGNGIKAFGASF
jgi:hypothetical protein